MHSGTAFGCSGCVSVDLAPRWRTVLIVEPAPAILQWLREAMRVRAVVDVCLTFSDARTYLRERPPDLLKISFHFLKARLHRRKRDAGGANPFTVNMYGGGKKPQ